jgi:YHS domain-containing protein
MRLWLWMPVVTALAAFGCGGDKGGGSAGASPSPGAVQAEENENREPTAAATERDPVCGMFVDPKTAPKSTFEDHTFYFCSAEDKAKFDKDPGSYASQAP